MSCTDCVCGAGFAVTCPKQSASGCDLLIPMTPGLTHHTLSLPEHTRRNRLPPTLPGSVLPGYMSWDGALVAPCPPDTYMPVSRPLIDATGCLDCPHGATTSGMDGQTTCGDFLGGCFTAQHRIPVVVTVLGCCAPPPSLHPYTLQVCYPATRW